MRFQEKKR